jgi:hypothetical protein
VPLDLTLDQSFSSCSLLFLLTKLSACPSLYATCLQAQSPRPGNRPAAKPDLSL